MSAAGDACVFEAAAGGPRGPLRLTCLTWRLVARWTRRGLASLAFAPDEAGPGIGGGGVRAATARPSSVFGPPSSILPGARRLAGALRRYFAAGDWRFDLPLDLRGTPFQLAVWEALRRIPPGEVRTYGEVARAVGRPGAARAVGAACGANPVVIVVPCHRVVASRGLGGFGSGLPVKRRLLALEGAGADGRKEG